MSTFFYFAYGSNLLTKRIRINNKTAERVTNGILKNYRLDFADSTADTKYYSPTWNGCPATIIPEKDSKVIGVIWKIQTEDLPQLDQQEGVEVGIYKPLTVDIESMSNGDIISCRSYQLVQNPSTTLDPQGRCQERCPSRDYLNVLVNGAVESKIPQNYIEFLKSFKHNGNDATNKELVKSLCLDNLI
jgi:gamma-glutamylcyclotransferase